MKSKFIHRNKNNKLILFFNGWGMDESVVSHINNEDFDLCVFYNYDNNFVIDTQEFESYKELYVVAWSMGVWGAARALNNLNLKITRSIAINGTLRPVNDSEGIPVSIFKGTIDNFSDRSKKKFDRRMLGSKEAFERFQDIESNRTFDNQLLELELIYQLAKEDTVDYKFDKAIIGDHDLIFPTENQLNFWSNKSDTEQLASPHFPFFEFKTWSEIVRL